MSPFKCPVKMARHAAHKMQRSGFGCCVTRTKRGEEPSANEFSLPPQHIVKGDRSLARRHVDKDECLMNNSARREATNVDLALELDYDGVQYKSSNAPPTRDGPKSVGFALGRSLVATREQDESILALALVHVSEESGDNVEEGRGLQPREEVEEKMVEQLEEKVKQTEKQLAQRERYAEYLEDQQKDRRRWDSFDKCKERAKHGDCFAFISCLVWRAQWLTTTTHANNL